MAEALAIPPGEVIARANAGDEQIIFALAAAAERHGRDMKRWEALFDALEQLGKIWTQ